MRRQLNSLFRFARRNAPANTGGGARHRKGVRAHRAALEEKVEALDLAQASPHQLAVLIRLLAHNEIDVNLVYDYGVQYCAPPPDAAFYATAIDAVDAPRSLEIFEEMRSLDGVQPSRRCYVAAIESCADAPTAPLWREGIELLQRMRLEGGTHHSTYEHGHRPSSSVRMYSSAHLDAPCGDASAAAMRGCMRGGAWEAGLGVLARLLEEGIAPLSSHRIVDAILLGCAEGMPAPIAAAALRAITAAAAPVPPVAAVGEEGVRREATAPVLRRVESAARVLSAPLLRAPSRRQFHAHIVRSGANFLASSELLRCMRLVGVAPSAASFGAAIRAAEFPTCAHEVGELLDEIDGPGAPSASLAWRSVVTAALERARWGEAHDALREAAQRGVTFDGDLDAANAFVQACACAARSAPSGSEATEDALCQVLGYASRLEGGGASAKSNAASEAARAALLDTAPQRKRRGQERG